EHSEDRERDESLLVQVPEREQQEWARQRNRVELVERQPLRRREDQVDEREPKSGLVGADMLPCKPEDRERAERDRDRLDGEQHVRARPDPPEWREEREDHVGVRGEPRYLLAGGARHLEEVTVRGRPDRLHHVPEIEAAGVEGVLALDRE